MRLVFINQILALMSLMGGSLMQSWQKAATGDLIPVNFKSSMNSSLSSRGNGAGNCAMVAAMALNLDPSHISEQQQRL